MSTSEYFSSLWLWRKVGEEFEYYFKEKNYYEAFCHNYHRNDFDRHVLVVDTQGVEATPGLINKCHSLKCKQIDMSTTDQLTATFWSNTAMPL